MSVNSSPKAQPYPNAFYVTDDQVRELKEKFARLIRRLGSKNTKGSKRYEFEVDFAYAIDAIDKGPRYFKGKLFENANGITNSLVAYIKTNFDE